MSRIIKNTILNYLPDNFYIEKEVNPARIFSNSKAVKNRDIIYLCQRELRVKDNFALQFAMQKSKELNLPLKILHIKKEYDYKPKQNFIDKLILQAKENFSNLNIDFEIVKNADNELKNTSFIITDFNPIGKNLNKTIEIDGHNILPARYVTDKQEYNAATFRRKVYLNISNFLTEFDNIDKTKTEADLVLEDFIQNKLPYYAEYKNNPTKNVLSGLSKYLNLGFISAQRVALEVIKADVEDINKETFLEELIVRKELADNFCLYCKSFKNADCVQFWAKNSLENHKFDLRSYIYNLEEFENAQTHDIIWNATQKQLIKEGTIHGYLRMYWAKKILEWTESYNIALDIAIYLNDKYAYDSPSPSGYVGILWAITGLHDRAFQDWFITGKIRRMTYNSIKTKFKISDYIDKYL